MVPGQHRLRRWWWTVPVGVVWAWSTLIGSALLGLRHGGDVLALPGWNLVHTPDLMRARARARAPGPTGPDADYRTLMFHKGATGCGRWCAPTTANPSAAATRSGRLSRSPT